MHLTDSCRFLISSGWGGEKRWGVGGGEARGPSWRGKNKTGGGVEGLRPMCEGDRGVRWQCGKNILLGTKVFLPHCQTSPPTPSHPPPHHPHTPPPLLFSPSNSDPSLLPLRLPTFPPPLPIWALQSNFFRGFLCS
jgi:hypothetical protein